MIRLAGRPRVMAVIGEPIWVMNPICFDARAAKAVRACIVTGNSSSPRSRNIPFFQVTYNGNQVALFVGTPIWTGASVSAWAPYKEPNSKVITADRLIIRFSPEQRILMEWNSHFASLFKFSFHPDFLEPSVSSCVTRATTGGRRATEGTTRATEGTQQFAKPRSASRQYFSKRR